QHISNSPLRQNCQTNKQERDMGRMLRWTLHKRMDQNPRTSCVLVSILVKELERVSATPGRGQCHLREGTVGQCHPRRGQCHLREGTVPPQGGDSATPGRVAHAGGSGAALPSAVS
uniref:Uncharacterized protein n=1 Tax=Zonotrichia albicollis TaxID=44394 RepID=A0A8D2MPJ9_ZONAL